MSKPTEQGPRNLHKPTPFLWAFACLVVASGLVAVRSDASDRQRHDRGVCFVHATDPHIFSAGKNERDNTEQNQRALLDLFEAMSSLPGGKEQSAFLVLTGDLGIDPCDISKSASDNLAPEECVAQVNTSERGKQIELIAGLLGKCPVSNIYLVAGNNDIAKESAGDEALKYFNDFIDDVQKKLVESNSAVRLHNLTSCYLSTDASVATCFADVPGTDYRFVGFPSYSFKNDKNIYNNAALTKQQEAQTKQFEKFQRLLAAADQDGKKVLIITHTPAMDDPYDLARARYVLPSPAPTATVTPGQSAAQSASVGTWKVSDKILEGWKKVIASDRVAAILAGHLHDAHKEAYRRPYAWSSSKWADLGKLFLAPPLAVKNQVISPIQARGFSLVHLLPDRIRSRLYWYDSQTGKFTSDTKHKHLWWHGGFWLCLCHGPRAAFGWLWDLEKTDSALVRMAVMLIAFLTAFLTIVAIWQIPSGSDPFAEDKKDEGASKPAPAASKADTLPFSSRFGKTVIGGLAGLVAAEVTKTLGNEKPSADSRWYYIVWFILFFFLLLLSLNFLRALVEGLRSRFAIIYYPLPRPPEPYPDGQAGEQDDQASLSSKFGRWIRKVLRQPGKFWRWLVYRFYAGLHWLSSLRVPLLTFSDTFTNLIQGKNETITQAFSDKIVDQQRSVLRAAKAIREQLNTVILEYLRDETGEKFRPEDVRVNISILSVDQTNVFYISKARDSSRSSFSKRSVAWISVFTGKIRWFKKSYTVDDALFRKIILFDNSAGTIADSEATIHLNSHYQTRGGEDYEGFAVFPVPLSRRGLSTEYVKGAIHISFSRQTDFELVWSFTCTREQATQQVDAKIQAATDDVERERLRRNRAADINAAIKASGPQGCDPVTKNEEYESEQSMLGDWCKDPGVNATLNTSLRVLGEVLRGFNEHIYKSIAKSEQTD